MGKRTLNEVPDERKARGQYRLAGSALFFEDGSHVFTPYQRDEGNVRWLTLATRNRVRVRLSKNLLEVECTAERDGRDYVEMVHELYGELCGALGMMLSRESVRKYSKICKRFKNE